MQVTFIVNSKIRKLNTVLQEIGNVFYKLEGVQATILQTHHGGHATELAKEVTQKGSDYLIAVGGDGTLNEVLNGILQAAIPTNTYPILGALPRGSANDFVKTVNISRTMDDLAKCILSGDFLKIDIGKVEIENNASKYFINIAGLGLGPEVVKIMGESNKIFGSKISYFTAILKGFSSYKKRSIRCESEHWTWEGDLLQMAVANGRFFGDSLCVAPEASVVDGILHVTIFGELSLLDYLKNLGRLKKGKKIDHRGAHYFTTKQLRITPTTEDACGIETDGEHAGEIPLTIKVIPNAIRFLAP